MKEIVFSFALLFTYLFAYSQSIDDQNIQLNKTRYAAAEALIQLGRISEAKEFLAQIPESERAVEWRFLMSAADQSKILIEAEAGITGNDMALSPDGKSLAIAMSDSSVTVYQYPAMKILHKLRHHQSSVSTVCFSHNGRLIASGGRDHTVVIWNLKSGKSTIVNDSSFSQGIYQLRFHPGDDFLGIVSWLRDKSRDPGIFGYLKLMDTESGKIIATKELDNHPAAGLRFSPDGSQMILSSWGELVYGIHTNELHTQWTFDLSDPSAYNAFHALDLSPDGQIIAAGGADHAIYFINASDGQLLYKSPDYLGHKKIVKATSFSPDGNLLASSGADHQIIIWDVESHSIIKRLLGHTGTVTSLIWTDHNSLLSSSTDGSIRTWTLDVGFLNRYKICDYGPWQTPLASDHQFFATPCSDDKLQLVSVIDGTNIHEFAGHDGLCAIIHPNDSSVYLSSFDGNVKRWQPYENKIEILHQLHKERVDGIALLPTYNQVITAGGNKIIVWDEVKKDTIRTIKLDQQPFRLLAAVDQKHIIAGMSGGNVVKLSTGDFRQIATLQTGESIQEMALSPDGRLLAVFSGNDIYLIDYKTFILLFRLKGHTGSGYGLDFSPDGKRLLSASGDQSLRFWDITTGECLLSWKGMEKEYFNCKFINNEQLIVTTGSGELFIIKLRP